ncbi:ABC transporter permease [Bacteroidales bacterium OttesenSCG-928-C19]|nr:ABC transporter permease [Bacteroidales bacterium OttesenSCG-928-C19]
MTKFLRDVGEYFLLLKDVFRFNSNRKLLYRQFVVELKTLGLESLGIVIIVSMFVGAAITLQLADNLSNPIYPRWVTGYASRKAIVLEFAPTIISLILAGKVGSRIASELGSMRISEQIDALDVMGVNSANYLIAPKVLANLLFNPFIIIISVFFSLFGGWIISTANSLITTYEYIDGLQLDFTSFEVTYAIIKGLVFAFIIATVSCYRGYTVKGGSLEVGRASTRAVVESSIILIISNLMITQLLL